MIDILDRQESSDSTANRERSAEEECFRGHRPINGRQLTSPRFGHQATREHRSVLGKSGEIGKGPRGLGNGARRDTEGEGRVGTSERGTHRETRYHGEVKTSECGVGQAD